MIGRIRSGAAALAVALAACGLPWETAGGGSGTETTGGAKVAGSIVYPGGAAAAGAYVSVRAAAWPGDTAADTGEVVRVYAGRDGSFRIDSLASGDYVLVAGDDKGNLAMAGFRNDAERKTQKLPADTLRPAGGLKGTLDSIQGRADTGAVEVFGLGRTARADAAGAYRIEGLPSGRVRLRARSTRPHYAYPDTAATVVPAAMTEAPAFRARLAEDYSAWARSRVVTIDLKEAGVDSTVRDFPLAVRMTGEIIDLPGNGGRDLRFVDAQGRRLAHALQGWEPARNYAMAWVRMDSIQGGATTAIRMYWGMPDAPDLSDPAAVFSDFAGAWHLHDSLSASGEGSFRDASPNGAPAAGAVVGGAGEPLHPGGQAFAGVHGLTVQDSPALKPAGGLFLSAWIRQEGLDSLGGAIATLGENYGLRTERDGLTRFFLRTEVGYADLEAADTSLASKETWHLVSGTYDGDALRVYLDGEEHMSTRRQSPLAYPRPGTFRIGSMETEGWGFTGRLAGVVVSGKPRTRSWIRLQYQNQKPNSGVVAFVK